MTDRPNRMGEVAATAEVSTRTLRCDEELGLVNPAGHSPGGSRPVPRRATAGSPRSGASTVDAGT
jgi:hypothetical protein